MLLDVIRTLGGLIVICERNVREMIFHRRTHEFKLLKTFFFISPSSFLLLSLFFSAFVQLSACWLMTCCFCVSTPETFVSSLNSASSLRSWRLSVPLFLTSLTGLSWFRLFSLPRALLSRWLRLSSSMDPLPPSCRRVTFSLTLSEGSPMG